MKHNSELCTAALSSLTYAMKAQRALADAGLHSDIVKLDARRTKRGCAYGVCFLCEYSDKVKRTLKDSGIGVSSYISGGGEGI